MTREEALRKTEGYLTLALGAYLPLDNCEEVDEIIKALKQEPVLDKIKDYINHIRNTGLGKKKSLEFIEKYIDGLKAEIEQSKGDTISEVEKLPSAISQPKTGQWIDGEGICPCCGKDKYEDLDADIYADWQPKFCPNCGAKMELSERRRLLINKKESEKL